ncbi:hypothetical protein CL653_03805 [bacterium]|nr:hypothetical protein [bacterium]|tara:strand:- start:471 stop:830 length:360 start_codon:yes stop_codon:yes gene_type:complete
MAFKLTKKRKAILEVLKRYHGTLSAQDIHIRVKDMDLTTVYRNLDLFVKEKLITRVILDTDEDLYEYQAKPHHHAVCTDCNRIIHFTACDKDLEKLLKLKKFKIENIEVTVRGTCGHGK